MDEIPKRPKVYVAGPMTDGGGQPNILTIKEGVVVSSFLMEWGYIPFCPQLSFWANQIRPTPYDTWIDYDKEWIEVCDCLLRLPGDSRGADLEAEYALSLGLPVFLDLMTLVAAFPPPQIGHTHSEDGTIETQKPLKFPTKK